MIEHHSERKRRFRVYVSFEGNVEVEVPETIADPQLLSEKVVMSKVTASLFSMCDLHDTYAYKEYMDMTGIENPDDHDYDAIDKRWKQVDIAEDISGSWDCDGVKELQCRWVEMEK